MGIRDYLKGDPWKLSGVMEDSVLIGVLVTQMYIFATTCQIVCLKWGKGSLESLHSKARTTVQLPYQRAIFLPPTTCFPPYDTPRFLSFIIHLLFIQRIPCLLPSPILFPLIHLKCHMGLSSPLECIFLSHPLFALFQPHLCSAHDPHYPNTGASPTNKDLP